MIKTRWKRNIILYFSIFIILISSLSPTLNAFADYETAKTKFNKAVSEFLGDIKEAKDVLRLLEEDSEKNPKPDRDSISYVMKRMFYPGVYANDVRDGVVAKTLKKKKKDILYDGIHICNPNAPDNLIDNNCNIPNFTTSLIQGIANPFMADFNNAGKTSSYSVFGLGVPENIPGGTVPVKEEERKHTYTALELFGYSLPRISYNGEWDQIVVNDEARMLSNFGLIDNITLVGTGLWNSVKAGVGAFIENFSFNPVRWFRNLGKVFEGGLSSGINTIVDTSELNVYATNGWKRPRLDSSLYNIYVMTDAEVLRETARNYFTIFTKELNAEAEKNPRLKEVLALNPDTALSGVKAFKYDPKMETEKSKAARKKAEEKRASQIKHNKSEKAKAKSEKDFFGGAYKPKYKELTEIPKPVYYTESEQLGLWEKDPGVSALLSKARKNNLLSKKASGYKTYKDMVKEWEKQYEPFFKAEFDANGDTIKAILEEIDVNVFTKYPHLDPKQGISRYACANPDGTIMRKKNKTVEYLYLQNNNGSTEYLNPKCSKARSPIDGGLLGTGWDSKTITDTRHISNVSGETGVFHQLNNMGVSTIMGINSFIAKFTNVVLNLSFTPILEKLGVDTIVAKLVNGFKETIFFPLASLVIAIGALMIFFQILRNGSAYQLLASVGIVLITFVAGAAFLIHPSATVNLIDKVPAKVDEIVANSILVDDEDTSYCSTGKESNGIRSAQCNIWGAMVFEPWVHLQFGTGSDNLYAKGHIPKGSSGFKNKNEELVGDAAVNMGGGKIQYNWALYQLSKTKAGTINQKDNSTPLGVVDKDLYRLVDLQAGPDNAAASDSRYFDIWSGKDTNGFLVFLTLIQSIAMGIAIVGLGVAKIEVSFMFSISILFLPIMLLYGLLPVGRGKLIGYIGNLGTLLLKRAIITVMLAVLLKIITLSYSKASSLEVGALTAIFISVAFIIYRKEILKLITLNNGPNNMLNGDTTQIKETIAKMTPRYLKQSYNVVKQNTVGAAAGLVGAAAGATEQKMEARRRISGIRKQIKGLEKLQGKDGLDSASELRLKTLKEQEDYYETALASRNGLSKKEYEDLVNQSKEIQLKLLENEVKMNELMQDKEKNKEEIIALAKENEELEAEKYEISKKAAFRTRDSRSIISEAFKGSEHSKHIVGRMAERKIRKQGFAALSAYKDIKDTVFAEGAEKITNRNEEVEYDVYKEVMSKSKNNMTKSSKNISENESGQLKASPKIQREIRELADKRRKMIEEGNYNGITPDMSDIEKAARIVDRRRGIEKVKLGVKNPIKSINSHKHDLKKRSEDYNSLAKADTVKNQLLKDIESKGGSIEYDNIGNHVVRDKYSSTQKENKVNLTLEEKELIKRANELKNSKFEEEVLEDKGEKQVKDDLDLKNTRIKEEEHENEQL